MEVSASEKFSVSTPLTAPVKGRGRVQRQRVEFAGDGRGRTGRRVAAVAPCCRCRLLTNAELQRLGARGSLGSAMVSVSGWRDPRGVADRDAGEGRVRRRAGVGGEWSPAAVIVGGATEVMRDLPLPASHALRRRRAWPAWTAVRPH